MLLRPDKASTLGHDAKYCKRLQTRFRISPKGPTFNPELANCLKLGSLLRVKHLLLEPTPLTENYIAAATVPHAGSAMTCHHFARKFSPSVKAMDRLAAAAEVAVEAAIEADVEDEEDDTRKQSEN